MDRLRETLHFVFLVEGFLTNGPHPSMITTWQANKRSQKMEEKHGDGVYLWRGMRWMPALFTALRGAGA